MEKTGRSGDMNLVERFCAPTPKFFRGLRNIGLVLVAAGGAIVAAPVALPAALVTFSGYLIVAGTVAGAVSQAVVEEQGVSKKK